MSDIEPREMSSPRGLAGLLDRSWMAGAAYVAIVAAIVSFPILVTTSYPVFIATQIGIYLLVAIGLNILTGYAGIPSLGHGALVAIGAYAAAITMVDYGWSFWPAAALALVLTSCVGLVMALPAFRLSSWYFALITLAFASVTSEMITEWSDLTHSFSGVIGVPAPVILGHSLGSEELFWLTAAVNIIAFILVARLIKSRFGLGLAAIRDNPEAALSSGVSLGRLRIFAFLISAATAGIAGALFAVQKQVVTPDEFTIEFSIFFLVVVVLGGAGTVWGPVLGALAFFALPELLEQLQGWRFVIYGILLLVIMLYAPQGLNGAVAYGWQHFRKALGLSPEPHVAPPPALSPEQATDVFDTGVSLTIEGVGKHFGGVTALEDISIEIPAGTVHAIVGPNGSGKTTLLNLICGYYRLDSGRVTLGDVDITGKRPVAVARLGVGRSFQTPKLVDSLSTIENVLLGGYGRARSSALEIAFGLPRYKRENSHMRGIAMHFLEFVDLGERHAEPAGDLPHGQQRLAEIARALIGRPRILLLDEPAAGLSLDELKMLENLIRAIRDLGITVVIVEHHLELVANVCDHVTVLDQGRILASEDPQSVFEDERVVQAYMGVRPLDTGSEGTSNERDDGSDV